MAKKNKSTYQLDLFCDSDSLYKITKPIRLIEFFAGVGFQRMGIQKVFPNLESWKICEWAIPSIIAYDIVHTNHDDPKVKENEQLAKTLDKNTLVKLLLELGVSKDYNVPATEKELLRLEHSKLISIYLSIINTHNLVNIMNVKGEDLEICDTDKYEYVVTYSFPCQSLSLAGKKEGMSISQKEEGGTRSGLVWELLRVIQECKEKPQLLLMENVPQVHSKDNNNDFYRLQVELQKLGYNNFWQDMNAKHYGIPQNRDRTFMLSILDKNAHYVFPEPEPLKKTLQDLLEDKVDEKYYLSDAMVQFISTEDEKHNGSLQSALVNKTISTTITTREGNTRAQESNYICNELPENTDLKQYRNKPLKETLKKNKVNDGDILDCYNQKVHKDICHTITTRVSASNETFVVEENQNEINKVGNYGNGHHAKDVYDPRGISPTITTGNHGLGTAIADSRDGLKIKNANSKGYLVAHEGDGVDISTRMEHHRGTVQKKMSQTLTTQGGNNVGVVVDDKRS